MKESRSRYGLRLISASSVKDVFREENDKKNLNVTIFGNDQSPANTTKCHWMTFLNQDTPVLFGQEKYAKDYDYPVIYGRINKVKRGHYTFEMFDLCPEPQKSAPFFITEESARMLEKDIRNKPEFWLWSHKRWKHKRPT